MVGFRPQYKHVFAAIYLLGFKACMVQDFRSVEAVSCRDDTNDIGQFAR